MWDDLTVQNQFAFYRPDSEVVLLYTAMILLCRRPSHTKLNDRLPGKTLSSTSVFALPIGIEKGLIRFTDCKRLGPARPAHIVITFVAHPHRFSIADGMTAPITDVAKRIAGNHHGVLFGALGGRGVFLRPCRSEQGRACEFVRLNGKSEGRVASLSLRVEMICRPIGFDQNLDDAGMTILRSKHQSITSATSTTVFL